MTSWRRGISEPFCCDPDFWRSVGGSVDALLALVVAAVLTMVLGPLAAVSFAIPLALLVHAGVTGRRCARRSRAAFATKEAWRDAERHAVASVLPRAVIRARWPLSARA